MLANLPLLYSSAAFSYFSSFSLFSPLPHSFSGLSFGNFSSYPFLEYETILEKIKWNQILFLIQNAFQTPRFFCSCWAASANWPELLSWQGGALYNRFTPCWATKLLQKPETIFFIKQSFSSLFKSPLSFVYFFKHWIFTFLNYVSNCKTASFTMFC